MHWQCCLVAGMASAKKPAAATASLPWRLTSKQAGGTLDQTIHWCQALKHFITQAAGVRRFS
eukprot:scaffold184230_cov25-Tisochrysis_lutea.AAC.2